MTKEEIVKRTSDIFATFKGLSLEEGMSVLLTAITSAAVEQGVSLEMLIANVRDAYANVQSAKQRRKTMS